jgi:hypothetical protein
MGGMVGLWGASSLVKSVQRGVFTIAFGSTSASATIAAVDLANAILIYTGSTYNSDTSTDEQLFECRLTLTDATTVTGNRQNTGNGSDVGYEVIEFLPGVIKSVQRGTISLTGAQQSNTATITSVNTARTMMGFLNSQDQDVNGYGARFKSTTVLTNGTTVTTARTTAVYTHASSYEVVEFF